MEKNKKHGDALSDNDIAKASGGAWVSLGKSKGGLVRGKKLFLLMIIPGK